MSSKQILFSVALLGVITCGNTYTDNHMYIPIVSFVIGALFKMMDFGQVSKYKTALTLIGALNFVYEYYKHKKNKHSRQISKMNHVVCTTILYSLLNKDQHPVTWIIFGLAVHSVYKTSLSWKQDEFMLADGI